MFGRRKPYVSSETEHAVIVRVKLTGGKYGTDQERSSIFKAGRRLHRVITRAGVGEHDGNEFGGGEAVLYSYGPDADRLFAVVEPVFKSFPMEAVAVLRYGAPADPQVKETEIPL